VRTLVAVALLLAAPALARAEALTSTQLRVLAARAAVDPGALGRLRGVDRVDGRPVDLSGVDSAARARVLAADLDTRPAAVPRGQAQRILAGRRFHEAGLPHPFRRPLRWLGDRVRPVGHAMARAFRWLAERVPGGAAVVWLAIAALVAAAAAVGARELARRRELALEAARADAQAEDPAELERRAAAAERDGDWEAAVRLRFRAGLARLGEPAAATTGAVAAELRSPDFDVLGARFDAIVYGGEAAQPADAEQARERWPAVLRR
jgi:hypothetical protein